MIDFASRVTMCQPKHHSFDDFGAICLVTPLVSTGAHQGNTPGALSFNVPVNFTGLFSKNEATPSLLSLDDMLLAPLPQPSNPAKTRTKTHDFPLIPANTLLSNKCVSSALSFPLQIISLIRYPATALTFPTTSSAISTARFTTPSGVSINSVNNPSSSGESARYVAPVVTTCSARLYPISRGRKKELQASRTRPRRPNTNPVFPAVVRLFAM